MKIYNKLVRDKIPEKIKNNGEVCKTRILNNTEYLEELNKKIQEELKEYLSADNDKDRIEELADLEEVLRAILDAKNVTQSEFEEVRKAKVEKRGAFKDRIFLISTDSKK